MIACPDCDAAIEPGARACPACRRALATRRCEACGARALVLAARCETCAAALSEKSAIGLGDATCPGCDAALGVQTTQGVRFHECTACGGLFFDRESFARATDDVDARAALAFRGSLSEGPYRGGRQTAAPPDAAPIRARFYRRCPACRTVMSRVNFGRRSGVFLDVCPRHGTWLDRDELAIVLAFVDRGGLEASRRALAEEKEREASEARQSRTAARVALASEPDPSDAWEIGVLVDAFLALIGWR